MDKLEGHIDHLCFPYKKHPIYVACSGGVDSTVLLYILNKLGYDVHAMHMNYHLRDDESNEDAQFIEQFAGQLNIPFQKRNIELAEQLKFGGNLQEFARIERFKWFNEIVFEDHKRKVYIALAHNQEDQTETFFMNLARKSGVMGLACMKFQLGNYLRPLLDISKEEIIAYAYEHQIKWREDRTNQESKYTRNKLRNIILPELRKQIPSLDESVSILTKQFQQKQMELEKTLEPVLDSILEHFTLSKTHFDALNEFEQVELFRKLGQPVTILHEVKKMNRKGARVRLIEQDELYLKEVVFEDESYSFTELDKPLLELDFEYVQQLPETFDKDVFYIDEDKALGHALVARYWEIGDRIAPIGMKGTQLISDIINDAGLNTHDKEHVVVVHDNSEIHWVPGLKIGRHLVADRNSKRIIKCTINPQTIPG